MCGRTALGLDPALLLRIYRAHLQKLRDKRSGTVTEIDWRDGVRRSDSGSWPLFSLYAEDDAIPAAGAGYTTPIQIDIQIYYYPFLFFESSRRDCSSVISSSISTKSSSFSCRLL